MKKEILVVGSVNLDLVVHGVRLPLPGETIHGDSFEIFNGGKGANQAVGVAKLGGCVDMIACLGTDIFSERLLSGLREAGVRTRAVEKIPGSSGVALISTAANGDNSIVIVAGANGALSPAHIDAHLDLVQNAGMILVQLETPMETVVYLAERAWEAKTPLMLDPAPATALPTALLRRVTWLTPNESEAQVLLAGENIEPQEAAARFLSMGVQNVALKLGAKGVLIAGQDVPTQAIPAFSVRAVDTTAAGDSFNAAFALALTRGDAPGAAARYAALAAAISVTRAGAQPSLPTFAEVEKALASSAASDTGPKR